MKRLLLLACVVALFGCDGDGEFTQDINVHIRSANAPVWVLMTAEDGSGAQTIVDSLLVPYGTIQKDTTYTMPHIIKEFGYFVMTTYDYGPVTSGLIKSNLGISEAWVFLGDGDTAAIYPDPGPFPIIEVMPWDMDKPWAWPDSAIGPPDSSEVPPDTTEVPPDTSEVPPDTTEIPPDTTATPPPETGRVDRCLIAFWDFEEGQGSVVYDDEELTDPPVMPAMDLTITPTSAVEWVQDGIKVTAPVVIQTTEATKLINLSLVEEMTIEAWVRPATQAQYGPARILSHSLDGDDLGGNFVFGQDGGTFETRMRATTRDHWGKPGIRVDGVLGTDLEHLVYTFKDNVATVYVNGQSVATMDIPGTLDSWGDNFKFTIANEGDGGRPWLGTVYLVAIYDEALTPTEVMTNFQEGVQ